MQPQNEDQVRSMRELLQSRKDVSTKRRAFFCVLAQKVGRAQSALLEKD